VINHDAEGTEVRNTPRGGDQRIRDALNDLDFKWSRRQQKWYQQRDTPFEDRDTAVRGLRVAFERLGVPYTYNGPDPAPEAEDTPRTEQETTAAPSAPDTGDTETTPPAAAEPNADPAGPDQTAPTPESQPEPAESTAEITHAARTPQSPGWAIMAVLSEDQVKTLVSAVTVDRQPVSTQSRRMPGDRVREWIAEQRQTPTTAFYASTSSDLPPAMRGNGDVRLSTRADGLTIEQGDVSTTILWEELPAWIDAAVTHDRANRPSSLPAWRYGSLHREIHFRIDERSQSATLALNALSTALRETTPPTDDELAEARERFAPPAVDADTAADAATVVQTPDGPGTVIGTDDGHLVLVTTESGTRVWQVSEVQWPDGAARPEYKFGVSADGAAILTPGDGDRPARRVALAATGKTTYTGVTHQYRLGETASWTNVPLANVTLNSNDPTTGRFLSTDPVYGGNANANEYTNADPVNRYDLDGKWGFRKWAGGFWRRNSGAIVGLGFAANCSAATVGWGTVACSVAGGAIGNMVSYRYSTPRRKRHWGGYYATAWRGAVRGGLGHGAGRYGHYFSRPASRWRRYGWSMARRAYRHGFRQGWRRYSRWNRW
jgi:hypothetical protein